MLPEPYSTGHPSAMIRQKKNPKALTRASSAPKRTRRSRERPSGDAWQLKGLPLAYNKDMQGDAGASLCCWLCRRCFGWLARFTSALTFNREG